MGNAIDNQHYGIPSEIRLLRIKNAAHNCVAGSFCPMFAPCFAPENVIVLLEEAAQIIEVYCWGVFVIGSE